VAGTIRKELERVTPAEVGLKSGVILEYLRKLETITEMHGFMLARHGKVCAEAWWKPHSPNLRHCLWSQTKSYTATAIGVLRDEGKIALDERIVDILPEYMPETPSDELKKLTVRDLLCMASGQHGQQNRTTPKWVVEFFEGEFIDVGQKFAYSGVVTSLLGVLLRAKTGEGLMAYMKPRIFDKLGIDTESIKWLEHPDGLEYGGGGLITKTEDNLRLGLLYINGGVFNGQRVVSEEWIREATRKQIDNGGDPATDAGVGYGYQIWMCKQDGAYRFVGAGGQYVIVLPKQDIVIATNQTGEPPLQLELMWKMLEEIEGEDDPAESQALRFFCDTRALPRQASGPVSSRAAELYGKTYTFEDNDWQLLPPIFGAFTHKVPKGIKAMSFTSAEGELRTDIIYGGKPYTLRISTDGADRMSNIYIDHDMPELVHAHGCWTAEDTFDFTINFIEGPAKTRYLLKLLNDGRVALCTPPSDNNDVLGKAGGRTVEPDKRILSLIT